MAATSPEPAFLHTLPPEIRNIIYRLALVQETDISVTANGLTEPGLLTVCKMIRKEAVPIFYEENEFAINADNYSPSAPLFCTQKVRLLATEFAIADVRVCLEGDPTPHWANLIRWCRAFHDRRCKFGISTASTGRIPPSTGNVAMEIAAAMLRTAEALEDRPWTEVGALLLPYRRILEAVEPGWMD